MTVYPRPRGGTPRLATGKNRLAGLSPPTRGNPDPSRVSTGAGRSIPAHAGEPPPAESPPAGIWVYPRPRGGTALTAVKAFGRQGLSPPTRGNRGRRERQVTSHGLSPPTRGNLRIEDGTSWRIGSIPAHAGEPRIDWLIPLSPSVYPRPRGGTESPADALAILDGLSPPTRGNHSGRSDSSKSLRSIPAHAGEPLTVVCHISLVQVYPRPRGGTADRRERQVTSHGLSPPTRGNRTAGRRRMTSRRSIPAHAGEPYPTPIAFASPRVYPRPRGGTREPEPDSALVRGLSPPTRGNPLFVAVVPIRPRSIPAHAGEPVVRCRRAYPPAVYPRPRGGTPQLWRLGVYVPGLSPPTRGNPAARYAYGTELRSIPAHAGEPWNGT